MAASYILRLDDATHFSDFSKWEILERFLHEKNIKPLVCVCPNNKDPALMYKKQNDSFWKVVRDWKEKDWDIAMHGFEHLFHPVNKGVLFFPFRSSSEFGGLSLDKQRMKIRNSLQIFLQNGIKPSIFAAPRHTFDELTIDALTLETDIRIISDGFYLFPHKYKEMSLFPQQLWWPKKKNFGVWTICLHPDTMQEREIYALIEELRRLELNFVSISDFENISLKPSYVDLCYSKIKWFEFHAKNWIKIKLKNLSN